MVKKLKHISDDPIYDVHMFDIDLSGNSIFLFGHDEYAGKLDETEEPGVEFAMANRFIRNMNLLMRKSTAPILIHMKTCGGYWEEGIAIYDTIKSCPNFVTILSYTHARSMSSIILQAADKRVMMPHSTFMFHEGTQHGGGTVKQFLTEAVEAKRTLNLMMEIYVDSMKARGLKKDLARSRVKAWLKSQMDRREEVYLTATQAVELGLADEVFDNNWNNL